MLHTPTIGILFAILHITAILVTCCNWWLHRPLRGPGWWAAGMMASAAGITILVLRGKIPDLVSIVAGNAVILGGMLTMLHGLCVFADRKLDWRIPASFIGIVLINHSYFTLVHDSLGYRWLVMAGLIAAIKGLAFPVLWHIGKRDGYMGVAMLTLSYATKLVFYIGHAVMTFLYERDGTRFFDISQLQSIGWLAAIILLLTDTFGYVLLAASRSRAELSRFALQDPLTGLANRRVFDSRLEAKIAAAHRNRTPLSLLCFDLDHFKRVNDTYGHSAGDAVLKHFADVGCAIIRANDDFARLGGEEFALVAPDANLATALDIAERLRSQLEAAPIEVDGETLRVTTSVGIAVLGLHGDDAATLTRTADAALYTAKSAGRNRVVAAGGPAAQSAATSRPVVVG